jgi:hypothetical protein
MKTIKILLTSLIMMVALSMGATRPTEPTPAETAELKQCGVTNQQICTYVRNLGHTVYWIQDIPGCCSSNVGVENCTVVTVYVSGGSIVGHADSGGICE